MKKSVRELLVDCIERSLTQDNRDFQWDTFFQIWFRSLGVPCFFLFKRHLGVTNTQYVELLSLLQLHCRRTGSDVKVGQLVFHTTEQVKASVMEAINMLLENPIEDRRVHVESFAATYEEVFSSTVAIDMFYCSCSAFFPPNIDVDLNQICADAGYLHSVGKSLFVRNITKARHVDFDHSIQNYLQTLPDSALPVPFVVYAHEDFSGHDRDAREQIHRGIESTKLYIDKMNMGGSRLSQIVHDMRTKYAEQLEIPPPGPYVENHTFQNNLNTLWLISDRSVSPGNPTNPGRERYYVCYVQTAKNDNPLFLFDENKPAWKSHTTLPHSLTAALLNAARPLPENAVICDPFGGTGTTWIEAKRLGLKAEIRCSDLSPAIKLLVRDNLNFFLMKVESLVSLKNQLQNISDAVMSDKKGSDIYDQQGAFEFLPEMEDFQGAGPYLYAVHLLNDIRHDQPYEDQEFQFSEEFIKQVSSLKLITRIVFYVVLRAELRFQGGYKRKSVRFEKAFTDSLGELIAQIDLFIHLRNAAAGGEEEGLSFISYQDFYSRSLVPAMIFKSFAHYEMEFANEVCTLDARELTKESIDLIICDPPYGFNTTEDGSKLAILYSEFLDSALMALRENGHLIICLPQESYTGRDLPFCTRSSIVVNQVVMKAQKLNRTIYLPARCLPTQLVTPPYYWEAERALRRAILHFRVF